MTSYHRIHEINAEDLNHDIHRWNHAPHNLSLLIQENFTHSRCVIIIDSRKSYTPKKLITNYVTK